MKKLIAIVLALTLALSLIACGTINKSEVSILWSGDGEVKVPNSLINAMERAMYIENIGYKHYGANGDQAKQTQQAKAALDAGCAALMVELVDATAAQSIVDLAKAKNVPVVFFNCAVEESVISGYSKCALVTTDETTLSQSYSAMLEKYVEDNAKKDGSNKLDLDGDGKIRYVILGELTITPAKNMEQVEASLDQLTFTAEQKQEKALFGSKTVEYGRVTVNGAVVEMILEADDRQTLDTLVALQAMDMNTDKLTTHFVPVFTVGADADYKTHVLKDLPAGEARAAYLEENKHLVDLTGIDEKQWDEKTQSMIYNTLSQCDAGKLANTVVEDYDAVATAAAALVRSHLKGEAVEKPVNKVPYISYME